MNTIEVEWKARPASGITEITLDELGCETEEQWNALSEEEQKKRIQQNLDDSEKFKAQIVEFSISTES